MQTPSRFLLTDIDDTLTDHGQLSSEAFAAMWGLHTNGVQVVPVTGRPAGWCEMIARMWPVSGVIGENGAFYFRYTQGKMKRFFLQSESERKGYQSKLDTIRNEILASVPGCEVASDQFCRLFDLAIDFCEDVPALPSSDVQKIVDIFIKHGATAKVSSIHVNGWFGSHDKLQGSLAFLLNEFQMDAKTAKSSVAFVGDSPNDEPMWGYFDNSYAVANIAPFLEKLTHKPRHIMTHPGGKGFVELAQKLLHMK